MTGKRGRKQKPERREEQRRDQAGSVLPESRYKGCCRSSSKLRALCALDAKAPAPPQRPLTNITQRSTLSADSNRRGGADYAWLQVLRGDVGAQERRPSRQPRGRSWIAK